MEIFNGDAPSTIKNWEAALLGFNKLEDYKDSKQKAVKCAEMIEQLKEKAEQERIEKAKKEEQARLEREKQAEEEKARKEQERIEKEICFWSLITIFVNRNSHNPFRNS